MTHILEITAADNQPDADSFASNFLFPSTLGNPTVSNSHTHTFILLNTWAHNLNSHSLVWKTQNHAAQALRRRINASRYFHFPICVTVCVVGVGFVLTVSFGFLRLFFRVCHRWQCCTKYQQKYWVQMFRINPDLQNNDLTLFHNLLLDNYTFNFSFALYNSFQCMCVAQQKHSCVCVCVSAHMHDSLWCLSGWSVSLQKENSVCVKSCLIATPTRQLWGLRSKWKTNTEG